MTTLSDSTQNNTNSVRQKNGRIEIMRFVFAICILMFHTTYWLLGHAGFRVNADWCIFRRYVVAVEFFFIVSGYLLAAKLARAAQSDAGAAAGAPKPYGADAFSYLIAKIRQILPDHVTAMILTYIVFGLLYHNEWHDFIVFIKEGWANIFLLQPYGFPTNEVNTPVWYLAVYLMVSFVYYYLGRKYNDSFVNVWCPLIAVFLYGFIAHQSGSLTDVNEWMGICYKYVLRGFAGMALGVMAWNVSERIKKAHILETKRNALLLNLAEAASLILVFRQINSNNEARYDFVAVFFVWIAFVIMVSKPADSPLNHKAVYFMGRMTLPLYLNQMWAIMLGQHIAVKLGLGTAPIIGIIIALALAASAVIILAQDRVRRKAR